MFYFMYIFIANGLTDWMSDVLHARFLGFQTLDYLMVALCIVSAWLLDKLTQRIIQRLQKHNHKAGKEPKAIYAAMIDALSKPLHLLFQTLGCCLWLFAITPPEWAISVFKILQLIAQSLGSWCVIWYLMRVTDASVSIALRSPKTKPSDAMILPMIRGVIKFALAASGILFILQHLGYSISSILAGLGIGGAAVALAAKDTIANFFGSLVVFFDHPFDTGDWVTFGDVEGIVEEIRIRTTLIRSFDGSVIMVPNSTLTSANIKNFERRQLRRLDANFGVVYSTTAEQIETIVSEIKKYTKTHPDILGPKYYIGFAGFGDSSLDIYVTVYSTRIAWADFCEVRQTFLLAVMRIVAAAGTSFAFPTRTLDLPKTPFPMPAAPDMPAEEAQS